jgi:pantoate--beta-alanine ligase
MRLITDISEMSEAAEELRASGKAIGFVPTMGYLHEGHLSLVRQARRECGTVVLSVFVNPAQFGPNEDLTRYPRDLEGDIIKCRREDVSIVFAPEADEMYLEGHATSVEVEGVSEGLCGSVRPGHFKGVATVVTKLLNIVRPHRAYFGQKDFQQTLVVRRLAKDLNTGVEVVVGPTVREPDGLAMSSRNVYLSPDERMAAAKIYRSLASARSLKEAGETRPEALVEKVRESLKREPLIKVEYVEVVSAEGARIQRSVTDPAVIALAVRIGKTRLIDNIVV